MRFQGEIDSEPQATPSAPAAMRLAVFLHSRLAYEVWKGREVVIVDHQPSGHGGVSIGQHPLSYVVPRYERKDPYLAGGPSLAIPPPNHNQRGRQLARETQACERSSTSTTYTAARRGLNALYLGAKLAALTGDVIDWSSCRKLNDRLPAVGAGDAVDYIRNRAPAALRVADLLVTSHRPIVANVSDGCPALRMAAWRVGRCGARVESRPSPKCSVLPVPLNRLRGPKRLRIRLEDARCVQHQGNDARGGGDGRQHLR